MPVRIALNELGTMSPAELQAETATLMQASRQAEVKGTPSLDSRIRKFEVRYEMTSDELQTLLAEGDVRETAEIAEWLFLLDMRDLRAIR